MTAAGEFDRLRANATRVDVVALDRVMPVRRQTRVPLRLPNNERV